MPDKKIPWLAEASHRLRLLHNEIDAAMRRLAWGEQFDHEHIMAFLGASVEAHRINADVITYVTQGSQRRAYVRVNESRERQREALQRMAACNGNGHAGSEGQLNGAVDAEKIGAWWAAQSDQTEGAELEQPAGESLDDPLVGKGETQI
jgi:hypothetical protein